MYAETRKEGISRLKQGTVHKGVQWEEQICEGLGWNYVQYETAQK